MYICAVGFLLSSKFTALQIFQDALLQRQSFVEGGVMAMKEDQGLWRMAKRKSKDMEKPALKPTWTGNSKVCCFGILRGEETLVISLIMECVKQ